MITEKTQQADSMKITMTDSSLIHLILISILLCCSCGSDTDIEQELEPKVKLENTYEVLHLEDIKYAEGLSHSTYNSEDFEFTDLLLDIYLPDNDSKQRPVFLFIHGGGFVGGSKQQDQIINFANYYASRGWVFISIDYRLKNDLGTIPSEWLSYASTLSSDSSSLFNAIYPAQRDAKAALRWLVKNADDYFIDTDYITIGGGSAGAITAITAGISNQEDFRDELNQEDDPSLLSTNLDQSYEIKTIIDLWGSDIGLQSLNKVYDHERFDTNDPPLFIAHGTNDTTVPFSSAEKLKSTYEMNEIPLAYYPLEGQGHGPWNATIDGKRLEELAFEFIVEQQNLTTE